MEAMDARSIVVVVEDVEEARTALQWTLRNLLRYGDVITLLHVYPSTKSRSRKKLRLKGYQLALSFRDICSSFTNANIEIIVTEGDQEGGKIASMVREIGASTLVLGLHERSFLYKGVFFNRLFTVDSQSAGPPSCSCECGQDLHVRPTFMAQKENMIK